MGCADQEKMVNLIIKRGMLFEAVYEGVVRGTLRTDDGESYALM